MPHERFYTDQPLSPGETIALEETEFHHLYHVMRARVGDTVELVNGKNELATATLTATSKQGAKLSISSVTRSESRKPHLILAQAIPRLNRLEYILEKGTELGVSEFWLFPGILSEKEKFSENQLKRMAQLMVSAMKQCGRLDLPVISLKPPLLEWEKVAGTHFFGDTAPDALPLWEQKEGILVDQTSIFFIGPEKGFDERERTHLQDKLHARGVKLHPHILRVDTAPLVALSLLQVLLCAGSHREEHDVPL